MNLFVIIVSYNGMQWLQRCLDSVFNSSVSANVIVVDNKSTDSSVDFIEKNYLAATLIKLDKNHGFGKANNIGMEYALNHNADYIYLLNQDAWVKPDTFKILIDVQQQYPEYGIISPIQITANEDKLDNNFLYTCANKCRFFVNDLCFNKVKEIYELNEVMAAHWLITRDCLLSIGGFSPVFFHYGEDMNLQHRASYHGFKNGICPLTCAIHDREFRKETKQKIMYMKYVSLLIINSDITRSKKIKLKDNIVVCVKLLCNVLQYKSLKPILYLFKILYHLPKIYKYNKMTKLKTPSFLNTIKI
ncbi:MAG: glycosyltransferase family 2 protein [Prevotellaceae bacterium]|jgi:GT2 family glycosyltransferase|nr:glycosyltransferase family 2 protein [Prevotellaceae bacterium]